MPNQRTPIVRRQANTNYRTQLDKVTADELQSIVVEDGTMVECEQTYYVSINGDWIPFAPMSPEVLNTGWARYDDTQYNIGSPYNFNTNAFFLPNNGAINYDRYNLHAYNGEELILEEGCTYSLTIAFKAHIDSNNGHMTINLDCLTNTDYSRIGDVIVFPKGNGIEHTFSRVFNFYADAEAVRSGLKVKMQSNHAGSIYDVIYFIEKLSNA